MRGSDAKRRPNWRVINLHRVAQSKIKQGAFDEARLMLKEGLSLDEHDAHSWLSLARLEARTGHIDEARLLFTRANDACPGNVHIAQAFAVFEQRCGDKPAARARFELASQLEPSNAYVAHAWGLLEESVGNVTAAQKIYSDLIAVGPQTQVYCAWAALEAREGNLPFAREIYERGWRLFQDDGMAHGSEDSNSFPFEPEADPASPSGGVRRSRWDIGEVAAAVDVAVTEAEVAEAKRSAPSDAGSSSSSEEPRASAAAGSDAGAHDEGSRKLETWAQRLGTLSPRLRPREMAEAADMLLAWAGLEIAAGNTTAARKLLVRCEEIAPQKAKALLAMAHLEALTGQYEAARDIFQTAVDSVVASHQRTDGGQSGRAGRHASPVDDAEVFNAWAAFESKHGSLPRAVEILSRGRQVLPLDASLLQSLGTMQRRAGDVDGARASFRESISLNPRGPTYVEYAMLEAEAGDLARARLLFEEGAKADPSHAPLHSAWARFEAAHGATETARTLLRTALAANPSATLWHGWGKLEERAGNFLSAVELYEEGARSGSGRDDTSYLWHSLGSVLLQQRQLSRAADAFNEGLRRNPASSQLILGAAIVHAQKGDSDAARGQFLRAVQADSSHAQAWHHWGVMEARLGNADVARDLYRRGLRRCPAYGALWQASAKLESEVGEHARARRMFRQGSEACPEHAGLHIAWAYFEMHQGKVQKATDLLRRARELAAHKKKESTLGELYHVEALLYLKLGRPRHARQCVDEGLKVCPTHAPLYRVLGAMEDVAGDVEAARAAFAEGLRLNPGYAQLYHASAQLEGKLLNWGALNELNKRAKLAFPQPGDATVAMQSEVKDEELFQLTNSPNATAGAGSV